MVSRFTSHLIILAIAVTPTILSSEQSPEVLNLAHRGGKGLWPENTIYGYKNALASGADVLEIDIRRTKEGIIVISHDERVDKTTDGSGEIRTFTLQELQQLDAGYRWSIDGTYPYRGAGHIIPTLDGVLGQFPDARFNIDIKENTDELIGGLCDLIGKHNAHGRVRVASFHNEAIRKFRKRCPNVPTSAGSAECIRFFILSRLRLTFLYDPPFSALQVPSKYGILDVVNSTFIEAAHRKGLEVHAWTINDRNDMRRLIALGVDGIITDYPDRLSEVLAEEPSDTSAPQAPQDRQGDRGQE